ncbi:MAG: aspartate--tRNA(Asn) ligase [Candidatus Micrarchaeota archaeon]
MFRTHYIKDAKKETENEVYVAGWVHDVRDLGKLKFVTLRDRTGILQVIAKAGKVDDSILEKMKLNREDVVAFKGKIVANKIAPDGVELVPSSVEILSKVEHKLPVDPSDVVKAEIDTRLDYRYVDLRKKTTSAIFHIKSIVATTFRQRLVELGFLEIHPSCITGAATEGGSDVFQIQYFETPAYLVQSPQLYKQMAVIGGMDKVFITMPVFRAEKHNTTTHLNEITQMDIEMGFADHNDAMNILEDVTLSILRSVKKTAHEDLVTLGQGDLKIPDKIPKYNYSELVEKLNKHDYAMEWGADFSKDAEKKLGEILGEELYFIEGWPTKIRAFYSMPREDNEEICNAFDLIYRQLEISSGAQRIHNASKIEDQLRKRGLEETRFEFYLNAFRLGAPPHAGWSIGLERLTMRICGSENIREAMMFPRDRVRLYP